MKNKILMAVIAGLLLSGCMNEPKNDYLNNLKVSYTLTANETKVNQEDFEFYYGYVFLKYLNTMQNDFHENAGNLLPFQLNDDINSLANQTCVLDGYTDKTWEYYFADQAKNVYQEIESLYTKAIESGFELNEQMVRDAKDSYQQLLDYCKNHQIDEEDYLHSIFGMHATAKTVLKQYEKLQLVSRYTESFYDDIDEAMIQQYYEEHPDQIDTIDIRYFAFKKDEEGRQNAKIFASHVKTESDYQKQVNEFADSSQKKYYQENDASLRKNLRKADLPDYLQEYLFSSNLKINQVSIVESENSYDVVMLVKREKPTYHQVNISTIYLDARESDDDQLTQEKLDDCEKFARELLGQLNDMETMTIDTIHEYNYKYSDNKTNQGNYWGLSKRDCSFEIEKWIFDAKRKVGDIAVLPSTYGYTIVYYNGQGEREDLVRSEEALMRDLYEANLSEITSKMKVEIK